jgi:threonine/homoserine/homoserine lactone efflux protein
MPPAKDDNMSLENYFAFCLAALALALVPGPTVTVIVANGLRYGAKAGLMNVAGTQVGFIIWLFIAAIGLGTAIALMGVWFDLLRWAGAAYLVWLGIKLFRSKGDLAVGAERARPAGSFFFQGFVVIITNPKMLVLFGLMIPPFLSDSGNVFRETMLLGLTFMAIAAVGDTLYALLSGFAGSFMTRSRIRALEITSGALLAAGGVWMALRGRG